MSTSLRKLLPAVLLGIAAIASCKSAPDRAQPPPPTLYEDAQALPDSSAGAKPLASAAEPLAAARAGTWEGPYEATRAKVELAGKLKDRVRAKDDGRRGIGPGTITLTIAPTQEVSGKVRGALGDATVVGEIDGDNIRAAILPNDPNAPDAMTGVLDGTFKEGHIHATVRAGSADATIIRETTLVMQKH